MPQAKGAAAVGFGGELTLLLSMISSIMPKRIKPTIAAAPAATVRAVTGAEQPMLHWPSGPKKIRVNRCLSNPPLVCEILHLSANP
jgi:hypothetical protein